MTTTIFDGTRWRYSIRAVKRRPHGRPVGRRHWKVRDVVTDKGSPS